MVIQASNALKKEKFLENSQKQRCLGNGRANVLAFKLHVIGPTTATARRPYVIRQLY